MSYPFSREKRIVKTDDFSSVFRLRPRYRTEHFVLYAGEKELLSARLGIVVAKRLAPRAVTRNTIKRVCREVFRMQDLPSLDYIVRLSRPLNTGMDPASSTTLKQRLRVELEQLIASQKSTGKNK